MNGSFNCRCSVFTFMSDYFAKLEKSSNLRFIITLACIAFIIKLPFGILGSIIVDLFHLNNPLYRSVMQEPTLTVQDMILAVGIAPFLETILGQIIPIALISKVTSSKRIILTTSALVFMILHYPVIEFFPSAMAIGYLLAWAWTVKRKSGFIKAFIMISLIHSLHNVFVSLFAVFFF